MSMKALCKHGVAIMDDHSRDDLYRIQLCKPQSTICPLPAAGAAPRCSTAVCLRSCSSRTKRSSPTAPCPSPHVCPSHILAALRLPRHHPSVSICDLSPTQQQFLFRRVFSPLLTPPNGFSISSMRWLSQKHAPPCHPLPRA